MSQIFENTFPKPSNVSEVQRFGVDPFDGASNLWRIHHYALGQYQRHALNVARTEAGEVTAALLR